MTIRAYRSGWKVIVYAGLDPLTGKQRQITRQVNGSRRKAEADSWGRSAGPAGRDE